MNFTKQTKYTNYWVIKTMILKKHKLIHFISLTVKILIKLTKTW